MNTTFNNCTSNIDALHTDLVRAGFVGAGIPQQQQQHECLAGGMSEAACCSHGATPSWRGAHVPSVSQHHQGRMIFET